MRLVSIPVGTMVHIELKPGKGAQMLVAGGYAQIMGRR